MIEAIDLYAPEISLNDIYSDIAAKHNTTANAVARCISLCVDAADTEYKLTAKELIARVKDRIMFDLNE